MVTTWFLQKPIGYTNFREEIKIYVTNNVISLASEYWIDKAARKLSNFSHHSVVVPLLNEFSEK